MKTIVNYAQKVKEQHALNKTLAPVETDLTDASRSYAIGEQFINDGDLFRAKTPIAQHDALVLNTNYEAADDITTQIKNKTVTTDSVPTEGSTNPVQSNGVFVENRNIYAVMGEMGAKNLLPFDLDEIKAANTEGTWAGNVYTRRNVSFTVNSDYSVDVVADGITNTQASGFFYYSASGAEKFVGKSVTLTGCPISGGSSTYNLQAYRAASVDGSGGTEKDTGSGVTLDWMNNGTGIKAMVAISIGAEVSCNAKFKPMLRYAEDIDSTYQPYAKTNQQLTAENEALTKEVAATLNTLGAKNFLETLIGSGTTQGVTYTINADGSITLNGTCTAWTNIKLDYISGQKNIPSGSYILNGSISGNNKFRLNTYVDGTKMAESENGNEASFTIPSTATEVYTRFEIDSTATFNNETFYPMIRLSSIEDDTYAPYAKTNRELTAENQTLTNEVSDLKNFNSTHYSVTFQTLTVDLTNVTTLNDLGKAIINTFNDFVSSLSNKQSCKILNIPIEGWWRYFHLNRDMIFTNNSTLGNENLNSVASTNAGIDIIQWYLATTSRIFKADIATDGTVSFSNITTDNISTYSISAAFIKCEIYTYL